MRNEQENTKKNTDTNFTAYSIAMAISSMVAEEDIEIFPDPPRIKASEIFPDAIIDWL